MNPDEWMFWVGFAFVLTGFWFSLAEGKEEGHHLVSQGTLLWVLPVLLDSTLAFGKAWI